MVLSSAHNYSKSNFDLIEINTEKKDKFNKVIQNGQTKFINPLIEEVTRPLLEILLEMP